MSMLPVSPAPPVAGESCDTARSSHRRLRESASAKERAMKEVAYVFGALEEPDVEALMRMGTRQQLHVGDKLLTEKTHPDAIYLVLEGELSVSVKGRDTAV